VQLSDSNNWSPELKAELKWDSITLEAHFRMAKFDPYPETSALINQIRCHIETIFSQLNERYQIKKVWAKDLWWLRNRLLRKKIFSYFGLYPESVLW
jgi:hypothetical protein